MSGEKTAQSRRTGGAIMLTSTEVAAREGFSTKRLHTLVRQGRVVGVSRHGNAYVFGPDYCIKPSPVRRRKSGAAARAAE